jgi:hypothetical protein
MPSRTKFQDKADHAILALLTSPSIPAAAKAAGIGERTLRNWLQRPDFQHAYHQARAEMLQHSLGHVANALVGCAVVLRSIAMDPDATSSSRVAAARAIFDLALRDIELNEIQVRMTKLEEALARIEGAP